MSAGVPQRPAGILGSTASATRLAYAQRALDAALTASAKTFQLTLLDKLGR